jgi:hypothetical protein
MSDALTTEIAVAVTSSAVTSLAEGGSKALVRLVGALRERFRRQPAERGVLEIALENPDDPEARRALVQLLDEHARNDPEFARQMHDLWAEAAAELDAAMGSTTNTVRGDVGGNVVQTRDVYGGITLGQASNTPRDRNIS